MGRALNLPHRLAAHLPRQPLWICHCGQPWPCANARLLLKCEYDGNRVALTIYLCGLLHAAIDDLYRLNPYDAPAPGALFGRFVGWAARRGMQQQPERVQFSVHPELEEAVRTVNFTYLRQNLAAELDRVVDDAEEVVVTRSGHEPVVIVPLAEYESMKETEYLLRSPANAAALRRSIAELEGGESEERELIDPETIRDVA